MEPYQESDFAHVWINEVLFFSPALKKYNPLYSGSRWIGGWAKTSDWDFFIYEPDPLRRDLTIDEIAKNTRHHFGIEMGSDIKNSGFYSVKFKVRASGTKVNLIFIDNKEGWTATVEATKVAKGLQLRTKTLRVAAFEEIRMKHENKLSKGEGTEVTTVGSLTATGEIPF